MHATGLAAGIGRSVTVLLALFLLGGCGSDTSSATNAPPTTVPPVVTPPATPPTGSSFVLTSSAVVEGGSMPDAYSCDDAGSTLPLAWANAPAATRSFVILMTTLPGDGTTKWNWVVHTIPASTTSLARDGQGTGVLGVGSDGPQLAYNPPCSQGAGNKTYTVTIYALSGSPVLPASPSGVTGQVVTDAIRSLTLASTSLNMTFARTALTGSTTACERIRNSTNASTTGRPTVSCDATYAYVSSDGIAAHTMMNGITATNLQVPLEQNFRGAKGWRIPLAPAIAATTTDVADGPIGVAINGVPIFNPCKQGGCQNGDTKALGELDACNGHAGRADDYHYHAAPTCVMAGQADSHYWDTHPIGWALDGFAIFGFYNPDGSVATRDAICGGNTLAVTNAPAGYSYHLTDVSPYVLACLRGTPSPDLAGQGAKYTPLRQPPVTPFPNTGMTLTTDATDGYSVLQFTTSRAFTSTTTGTDSYSNAAGTYRIRYRSVTGEALGTLLALATNSGKTACWTFQFLDASGSASQPTTNYCR